MNEPANSQTRRRLEALKGVSVNLVAYIVAVVVFLLAGFGVSFGGVSPLELVAFGLAAFAVAHILP